MRTKNSIVNIIISCGSYAILMVSAFITRGVFTRQLGLAIVGIDKLFLDAVSMLAIVELGIGTGIVYKLYQPIADNDRNKIAVLLTFYKKAYGVIASVVLGLGAVTTFVIPAFINSDDMDVLAAQGYNWFILSGIFLFYVFDVLASYLYAHKRAMITADQKNYINTISHIALQLIACVLQISVLYLGEKYFGGLVSFIAFLVIKVLCRVLENVFISFYYQKHYADIDLKIKEHLPQEEKRDLFGNIKALMMHKIAGFSVRSASTMIITKMVDLIQAGIYSQYTLITSALNNITDQFFNGIVASFGNLISTETTDKAYEKFKIVYFMNFLMYSFFSVSLFICLTPFIQLWTGKIDGVFGIFTTLLIVIYFYLYGMRQSIFMARSSVGLYRQDRWFAVVEAILSIGLSLILVNKMQSVNGVLLASIISLVLVPFWTQPIIVYLNLFRRSVWEYYRKYIVYMIVTVVSGVATWFAAGLITFENIFVQLIFNAFCCLIIPNLINFVLFYKTSEMQQLLVMLKGIIEKVKNKEKAN